MRKTKICRVAQSLADIRKMHKDTLVRAFHNARISEVDVDKIYSRRLKNINVLEEYLKR